jgi:hypothetical protein
MGSSPLGLRQRKGFAMKRIIDALRRVIAEWRRNLAASRAARRRMKELRKRDPFIY